MLPFQHKKSIFIDKDYFDILNKNIKVNYDTLNINGSVFKERRGTAWFSSSNTPFQYGGKNMEPKKLPQILNEIKEKLKNITGEYYDSVLVNYYPDGNSAMKYHSDPLYDTWTENQAIVSFGSTRKLIYREKTNKDIKYEFVLNSGDIIISSANCQEKYQHCLKKSKNSINPRFSFN